MAEVVWPRHILSSPTGDYPVKLNKWEIHVLDIELKDEKCIVWYRNPMAGIGSLKAPYYMNPRHHGMAPDFVFFQQTTDGIAPAILDPHPQSLNDSVPKLKGLAAYAKTHSDEYQRIESIIKVKGVYYALNPKDSSVQDAVEAYRDARPEPCMRSTLGHTRPGL